MQATVAITAVRRIPPPKARRITCELCGWSCRRWRKRVHVDDPPTTGMLDMLAHELEVHRGAAS